MLGSTDVACQQPLDAQRVLLDLARQRVQVSPCPLRVCCVHHGKQASINRSLGVGDLDALATLAR